MNDISEKIKEIEEEIRKTPYHKGTEHHIGKLKARLAKLREEQIEMAFRSRRGGGGGYAVKKTGDASVVLIGPPSVGKSTLLNQLTRAESKIGAYDFTTLNVVPGMLEYQGAKIQIFDVPGIIAGAAEGKGRGKEVLAVARSADLIILMVDVKTVNLIPQIEMELRNAGVRLNEKPPAVSIIKKASGGLKISSTTHLGLSYETIKSLANEFGFINAEIVIRENLNLDRLVDAFLNNRAYLPYLIVINKIDLGQPPPLNSFSTETLFISSQQGANLEALKKKIWEKLNLIRVYFKDGDIIDKTHPLIIKNGTSLKDILETTPIHGKENFRSARVFGPGAKYSGQEVSFRFMPQDETIVQFV